MVKQKTLKSEGSLSGVGLHTGNRSTVRLVPAPENAGISIRRIDMPEKPSIPADIDYVTGLERGTCLGRDGISIFSVEHLMAAFAGMGIDNAVAEVDSNEIPLCDGSSKPFVDLIRKVGTVEQKEQRHFINIREPLTYQNNNVALQVFPSDKFRLALMVDYNHPALGAQHTTLYDLNEFEKEYATARTFCFLSEILKLREAGMIKGGNIESAIVVQDIEYSRKLLNEIKRHFKQKEIFWGKNGFINNTRLKFPNELCRHKALDIIGDLYLLGAPLRAHVLGARTGHAANIEMAKLIRKHCQKKRKQPSSMDIRLIHEILPHRYPFLLVDRVLELRPRKKIIAIKNVTANEPFFEGHFPDFPIMPGVLQIEALAQAGGLLAMGELGDERRAQVVYFMGIDNAKFRKPVVPGDQLRLEVEVVKLRGKITRFAGKAFVGKEIVCEAELLATFADKR